MLLVSVPYARLVTSVLFGKHIDRIEADRQLGVRTLPVILGEARARTVGRWRMVAFYALTILTAAVGLIGPWVLLVALAIPRLLHVLRTFSKPKPTSAPDSYTAGRSGSWAGRSSTRVDLAACSPWACSSTRRSRSSRPG